MKIYIFVLYKVFDTSLSTIDGLTTFFRTKLNEVVQIYLTWKGRSHAEETLYAGTDSHEA